MIKILTVIAFILCISCGQRSNDSSGHEQAIIHEDKAFLNPKKTINCFIYHRFGDDRYPSTNVSLQDFESHLSYLKESGFEVLTMSDAIKYLRNEEPLKKMAVITIDDGFKSFYENGLPLLEKYNFPATLFINTETVGGSSYMNWDEIKEAHARGIELGNHTHSHAFFLNMDPNDRYQNFKDEIELSQQLIQEKLGIAPQVFAYPYGEYDSKMKEIVRNAGFIAGLGQNSGVINNDTDLMACPRFPMATGFSDLVGFKLKANALPLKMTGKPEQHVLSSNYQPSLDLVVQKDNLRINEMQCFIQGGTCDLSISQKADQEFSVFAMPEKSIENRRRTLYTLTVQDNDNNWYWYSHLWINPKVIE